MAAPLRTVGPKSDKFWREAILRAVKRRNKGDIHAIDKLAERTVELGLAGDMSAIKEIGDRLDGRPHQSVQADIAGDLVVKWAEK